MPESILYKIEPLTEIGLLKQCVEIQRRAWGFSDEDLLPLRMLVVCTKIGGQVFGALESDGKVLGFLNAFPATREGKLYLHSQMMGVLPEYQNLGIGKQLKLAQRDEALKRGISRIEWTFDPLEIRNAQFNIENLGVICRRFYENVYGMSSSQLQAGLPTDRLVAEWHLDSARVKGRLLRQGVKKRESEYVLVELPSNMGKLKSENSESALQFQLDFRQRLLSLLDQDYCVTRFEIDQCLQKVRYCLEPFGEHILDL
jgi:predicted GNAT superfamily acetyltransferase